MPVFQPNIPTGSVPLDQDYLNLQGNNQQLDISYGVDHVPFSDVSGIPPVGISGMHKAIHLVPVSTPTSNPPNNQPINGYTALAGYGQVFDATINDGINTDTALYFLTGGNRLIQLTRNLTPTNTATPDATHSTGYTCLPGGIIYQWGFKTGGNVSQFGTITFGTTAGTIAFPNNLFNVQLTMVSINAGNNSSNNTLNVRDGYTKASFTWDFNVSTNNKFNGFFWVAIGN